MHIEADIAHTLAGIQVADGEDFFGTGRGRRCFAFGQIVANHLANQFPRGGFICRNCGYPPAIAHHGNAVGNNLDLIHAVADINNANAFLLKRPDVFEEPFDFRVGQRRGGFVQDQNFALAGKSAGNLNQLLVPHPQLAGRSVRIQIAQANASQRATSPFAQPGTRDPACPIRQSIQKNIFRNG